MNFFRSLIIILSILVFVLIGYLSLKVIQQYRIHKVVKDGQVEIDQQNHEWNVCNDKLPTFQIFVRNNSDLKVFGNLVFSVMISNKGLEQNFMDENIKCYGKDFIINDYLDKERRGVQLCRLKSLINYIERGQKLQDKFDYEPYEEGKTDKEYNFKIHHYISLKRGEILRIETEQPVPVDRRGGLTKIVIEDITF